MERKGCDDLQDEFSPCWYVHSSMFEVHSSIDHVRLLYHRIVVVNHRSVIYKLLLVVRNDDVRHRFDSIDLSIVEYFRVHPIISFVNHEPFKKTLIDRMKNQSIFT